jgi:hypothetical protein
MPGVVMVKMLPSMPTWPASAVACGFSEIAEHGHVLTPGCYVGAEDNLVLVTIIAVGKREDNLVYRNAKERA